MDAFRVGRTFKFAVLPEQANLEVRPTRFFWN
jgi:hypothetical protein